MKPDFEVLVDPQRFHHLAEPVLQQHREDVAVTVEMAIGSADDTDFSDTQHGRSGVEAPVVQEAVLTLGLPLAAGLALAGDALLTLDALAALVALAVLRSFLRA